MIESVKPKNTEEQGPVDVPSADTYTGSDSALTVVCQIACIFGDVVLIESTDGFSSRRVGEAALH